MPLEIPFSGQVIRYSYLWNREHITGQEEGLKDRPCAVVLTTETSDGDTIVLVAPITHSTPTDENTIIEIPAKVKQRLGLDSERSFIVVSETNRFIWPSPDIRPVSKDNSSQFSYGVLPPKLFDKVAKAIQNRAQERRIHIVKRTE